MTLTTDNDLYIRGAATLVASWEEYARGSAGAALRRLDGVSAAVFPSEPERAVYNNALLDRDLGRTERAAAVGAMEAAYDSAGVDRYAAWVHESDEGMRAELSGRGYAPDESTRAMGMSLDDIALALPEVELGPLDWAEYLEYLRIVGVPAGLLSGADPSAFHLLAARIAGENVATAIAFDHDGDCGLFNMSTLEAARRRGLGTALTARHVHDAVERGCSTASLQSTAMAERVYAAVGFRDLGRTLEYVRVTQGMADRVPTAAPTGALAIVTGATKVLLVSGSLRAESVNSAVLRTAAALAGDRIRTTLDEGMGTLPHFNPDDDPEGGPVPAAVADLRRRLADADAVLFCTPEYAGSLPGSFKNLLDWTVGGGETYGKPVAWVNASSRPDPDAGSGAHEALRTVLGYTGADIAAPACRRIQVPRTALGADGLVSDAAIRDEIATALRTLADYAATSKPGRPRSVPGPADS